MTDTRREMTDIGTPQGGVQKHLARDREYREGVRDHDDDDPDDLGDSLDFLRDVQDRGDDQGHLEFIRGQVEARTKRQRNPAQN